MTEAKIKEARLQAADAANEKEKKEIKKSPVPHLHLVTPRGVVLDIDVEKVILPGSEGPFAVLKNHAPLVASLKAGELYYNIEGKRFACRIEAGFCQIRYNIISVFVPDAFLLGEKTEK